MSLDSLSFRQALGQFVTGVTVITTLDSERVPIGFTANSFNSVSLDPPLVLWSLARTASTYEAFLAAEHFGVNVLAFDQVELSNRFASPLQHRFEGLDYAPGIGGVPLIRDCAAQFECRLEQRYPGGDHLIYLARVLAFTSNSKRKALAYYQGRYNAPGEAL